MNGQLNNPSEMKAEAITYVDAWRVENMDDVRSGNKEKPTCLPNKIPTGQEIIAL